MSIDKPDTTQTGEAWRDQFCPACKGHRQHERDQYGIWRCIYCGHEADEWTVRRLDAAESAVLKAPTTPRA